MTKISFKEFAQYLDSLIRGDGDKKLELTFRLIDIKKNGYFDKQDLYNLILSILKANGTMTTYLEKEYKAKKICGYIFQKICPLNSSIVYIQDFKRSMKADPYLLEIFTLLNQGISDTIVSLTIEEDRKMTYLNDIQYIKQGLYGALTEIDPAKYPKMNPEVLKLDLRGDYEVQDSEDNLKKNRSAFQTPLQKPRRMPSLQYIQNIADYNTNVNQEMDDVPMMQSEDNNNEKGEILSISQISIPEVPDEDVANKNIPKGLHFPRRSPQQNPLFLAMSMVEQKINTVMVEEKEEEEQYVFEESEEIDNDKAVYENPFLNGKFAEASNRDNINSGKKRKVEFDLTDKNEMLGDIQLKNINSLNSGKKYSISFQEDSLDPLHRVKTRISRLLKYTERLENALASEISIDRRYLSRLSEENRVQRQ